VCCVQSTPTRARARAHTQYLAFYDVLSPLRAATAGNLSQLHFLKEASVDFNQRGESGRAALHIAVLKQQREAVEFFGVSARMLCVVCV
jgi:ankyrin repeat protein